MGKKVKIKIKKEDLPKRRLPIAQKPNVRHKSKRDYTRKGKKDWQKDEDS